MTRITLLRHGTTTAGARYCGSTDVPLSPTGWLQLRAAVETRRWSCIVSSPLQRCAAFAHALAHERDIPCCIDTRWRELHFGAWEGRSAAELFETTPEALEQFWRDPVASPPPQAETLASLKSRVVQAWRALVDDPDEKDALVITHAGPIRILLAQRNELPLTRLLEIEVAHAQLIDLQADSACIPS